MNPRTPSDPAVFFDPLLPDVPVLERPNLDGREVPGDITDDLIDRVLNPEALPEPDTAEDPCDCGKKKKKKKKKREPRKTCWKGTYVQRASKTTFHPSTRVSCATGNPLAPRKTSKRRKSPSLSDLLKEI